MKKDHAIIILFATLLGVWVYNCQGVVGVSDSSKLNSVLIKNNLNWVEISNEKFSTQIMFDFAKPFYVEKTMQKKQMKLELSFPTMGLDSFKKSKVVSKIKEIDVVKNVFLEKRTKPVDRVVLTIIFKSTPSIFSGVNSNNFVIKWSKTEDPNRLILDIFTKDKLDYLKRDKSLILHAKNDYLLRTGRKKKSL